MCELSPQHGCLSCCLVGWLPLIPVFRLPPTTADTDISTAARQVNSDLLEQLQQQQQAQRGAEGLAAAAAAAASGLDSEALLSAVRWASSFCS